MPHISRVVHRHRLIAPALTAALTVACSDGAGPVVDRSAPSVVGVVLAHDGSTNILPAAQTYAAGTRVWLLLDVADDQGVAWLGFRVTGPIELADSAPVPGSLPALRVFVTFSLGSLSGEVQVRGFAVDAAGNRTDATLAGNPVSLYAPRFAPVRAAPLESPVADLTYDVKREQLFLAEPAQSRISLFSLIADAYGPPLDVPGRPTAMDVSASGDSLVVLLAETGELALWPLVGASPAWSVIPLSLGPGTSGTLRVAANNRVIVVTDRVIEYDLATGVETQRTDAGAGGLLPADVALERTRDGASIALVYRAPGSAAVGQVYDAASNAFLAPRAVGAMATLAISTDAAGRFLVGPALFDAALTPLRAFYPPGGARVAAVANAGDYAYFGHGPGYLRTRISDGVTLEEVVLPEPAERLLVLPGEPERVVAVGAGQLMVVQEVGGS